MPASLAPNTMIRTCEAEALTMGLKVPPISHVMHNVSVGDIIVLIDTWRVCGYKRHVTEILLPQG